MNSHGCTLSAWECSLTHRPRFADRPGRSDALPVNDVDAVYKKYAAEIDKMYEQRTRGDFSSVGILSEFARELKAVEERI